MKSLLLRNNIKLIVVRHGESDSNRSGLISNANIDHELTDTGVQQARETAERLKDEKIDLVLTSTRQRARLTADAINQYHGANVSEHDELVERNFGILGGTSRQGAKEKMQREGFSWIDIPGSELAEDIDARVNSVLKHLVDTRSNMTVLVSTHSDIVKSFYRVLKGKSVEDSMSMYIENSEPHYFP